MCCWVVIQTYISHHHWGNPKESPHAWTSPQSIHFWFKTIHIFKLNNTSACHLYPNILKKWLSAAYRLTLTWRRHSTLHFDSSFPPRTACGKKTLWARPWLRLDPILGDNTTAQKVAASPNWEFYSSRGTRMWQRGEGSLIGHGVG